MEQTRLDIRGVAPVSTIDARPRIAELRAEGRTHEQIAFRLNVEGVSTPSGRGRWYPTTVQRHANPEHWAAYMRGYRARHTR
jgi:hypothetical protein